MRLEKISNGVSGIDQILGGGLLKAGVYLVQGVAGAGKAVLANHIAFNRVAAGVKVAYVTLLAESHARMMQHMELFSFYKESVIPSALHYVSAFDALAKEGLAGVLGVLDVEMRQRKADSLVLDGLVTAAGASGSPQDLKLFVGEGCSVTVRFAPTTPGQESGALWLRNTTSTPTQLITFYGRGTGAAAGTSTLSFAPAPLQLPNQAIGVASAPTSLQLQNRGAVAITPTALVFNGPAAYDLSAVGDCAVGRTIPAGGACFLQITFTPQAAGWLLEGPVFCTPRSS